MGDREYSRARSEICSLLRVLVEEKDRYFSRYEYLNSDGRRVLEKVAKLVLKYRLLSKQQLVRVRRDPSIYRVVRLVEIICG